ncbi:MAG: hypothetical protein AB7T31_05860 [Gemmatimonadales bacterium]
MLLPASLGLAACELDSTAPIPDEPMTLVGADHQSRIWLVDEASGSATFLDSVFIQVPYPTPSPNPVPIGPIASMVWVPTADMWWVASARTAICESCIYRYDAVGDTARLVRNSVQEVDTLADFAAHPSTGRLYTFNRGTAGYLFRVDVTDGYFHEVLRFDEGESGKGSTFWKDGSLYVSGGAFQQVLTRIDLDRATTTPVGPITYVGFPPFTSYSVRIPSMATRSSDGVVFGLVLDGSVTYFATIDPTNAVVVNLGPTTPQLSALAYVPTRLVP